MTFKLPIVDLHCDLLLYLANKKNRTPTHPEARCSLLQLKEGGVLLQTMAIFTQTQKGSCDLAQKQLNIFPTLEKKGFKRLFERSFPKDLNSIYAIGAIENASGLCEEDEPLDKAFERLDLFCQIGGPLLYMSLTWNMENRFGGGNMTSVGLKPDGKKLLEYMAEKGMAIDLSHTSDHLADDILEYTDKKNLNLIPIASHSNFREVTFHPRNLPDRLAKEIIQRKGIIGFNAVRKFIGEDFQRDAIKHIEQADKLGGLNHLCFGADFFYVEDLPSHSIQSFHPSFDPFFENSSQYPDAIRYFSSVLSPQQLEGMAFRNFAQFLQRASVCC